MSSRFSIPFLIRGDGPNLPSARGSSSCDRILILGGLDGENNRTENVYELLSGSSSWTTKASMPTSRSVTASAVLDGKVWVVGGIDFSWSDKVEIFDPSTNSWTSGPSLNSPRVSPVAWVSSGILYVAGGYDGVDYLDSIESYDPVSNSWSIMGTLPHSIYQSDAVVANEEVFLVGGEKSFAFWHDHIEFFPLLLPGIRTQLYQAGRHLLGDGAE